MHQYSKTIKRFLRKYATEAYERELHRELTTLDHSFAEWRKGTISSGELCDRIHRYETGPSRALFKRYTNGPPDMNVAYALVVGILDASEVPAEVVEAISAPLSFYRALKAQNELQEPDETGG
jgi:hypothetical protein